MFESAAMFRPFVAILVALTLQVADRADINDEGLHLFTIFVSDCRSRADEYSLVDADGATTIR